MILRRGMWVKVVKGVAVEYRVDAKTGRPVPVLHSTLAAVDLLGALGIVTDLTEPHVIVTLQKPDGFTKRRPSWNETRMVDDAYACTPADLEQAGLGDLPKTRIKSADPKRLRAMGYK